jgi:hypothetical protein
MDGQGREHRVSEELVQDTKRFLRLLGRADRAAGGGQLTKVIRRERTRLHGLSRYEGKTLARAWGLIQDLFE